MIIVDTNVISGVARSGRDIDAVEWLDEQITETLYLTSINISELRLGMELLPNGKRKDKLMSDVNALISSYFGTRILSFDKESASAYGALMAAARALGRSVSVADGQIGAIASVHNFAVATRDTEPFMALGLSVINPWENA